MGDSSNNGRGFDLVCLILLGSIIWAGFHQIRYWAQETSPVEAAPGVASCQNPPVKIGDLVRGSPVSLPPVMDRDDALMFAANLIPIVSSRPKFKMEIQIPTECCPLSYTYEKGSSPCSILLGDYDRVVLNYSTGERVDYYPNDRNGSPFLEVQDSEGIREVHYSVIPEPRIGWDSHEWYMLSEPPVTDWRIRCSKNQTLNLRTFECVESLPVVNCSGVATHNQSGSGGWMIEDVIVNRRDDIQKRDGGELMLVYGSECKGYYGERVDYQCGWSFCAKED